MMSKNPLIKQILEIEAASTFPDQSSVVLPVLQKLTGINPKSSKSLWKMPVTAILLAIICLAVIATVGFAVYHFFFDPGLQGVKDAGLGTDLNTTAVPTLNPTMPTHRFQLLPATQVNLEQTYEGITVSLDWISVNQMRVLFGFSAKGLQPGMTFELPQFSITGITPEQYTGAAFEVTGGEVVEGEFISYQVLNDLPESGKVSLGIDLPLTQADGNPKQDVTVFHFDLEDIPANTNQPASGQQTFLATVNSLSIRMEWIQVKPNSITAKMCYDKTASGGWQPGNMTLETGSGNYQFDGSSAQLVQISDPVEEESQDCVIANLITEEKDNPQLLKLSIHELISASDKRTGPWDFYVMLPEKGPEGKFIANDIIATPEAPLMVESVGNLKAILLWAYADAHRVAMQIHFEGWEDNYNVSGMEISLKDDIGNDINWGMGMGASSEDPSTYLVEFYPPPTEVLTSPTRFLFSFPVYAYLGPNQSKSIASFTFDLSLPVYQAKTYTFNTTISENGIDVRLLKAVITPSYTDLTLCFTKPTHGDWSDWMLGSLTELKIGENKSVGGGGGVIYDSDFGGYVTKGSYPRDLPANFLGRCIIAGFPIGDLANPGPLMLVLTVPELQISMPEGFPDEKINKAISLLKAEGIEMSIFTSSGSLGGGGGYSFTAKPEGMTDEEAYHKFLEALGFIQPGPWVFTVQIP